LNNKKVDKAIGKWLEMT